MPFRESKLTQLLQSYFVGRAINREGRIVMFVNVADGRSVFSETYHVLKFSALASEVGILIATVKGYVVSVVYNT